MTKIEIVREDEKATHILKAIRLIDDGVEIEPVVRCKDCVFAHPCDASDNYIVCGQFYGMAMEKDWYCADGERKDNE